MVFLYLLVMAALICFPSVTAHSAKEALAVWGLDILPTLFPYMVLCRLLSIRMRNTPIPPVSICIVLGLLGGSPCGASIIRINADRLSRRSFHALCAMTGTISPIFFLGTMPIWTQNVSICRMMLMIHWAGAAVSGAIVWALTKPGLVTVSTGMLSSQENPLMQSIDAILQVGGCIICFSVLAGMLKLIPALDGAQIASIHTLLEVSGGVSTICKSAGKRSLPIIIAVVTGFSGLSILTQNHAHLKDAGITLWRLAMYGLLRALFSGLIAAAWMTIS